MSQNKPSLFPSVTVIVMHHAHVAVMTHEGEILSYGLGDRMAFPTSAPVMTCHAPWMASKLQLSSIPIFDVLELYAFTRPAQFVTPTLNGLATALELQKPDTADDAPFLLAEIAQYLLGELSALPDKEKAQCVSIAQSMGRSGNGWAWAPYVLDAMGSPYDPQMPTNPKKDMNIFEGLMEWAEDAPPPPNKFDVISGEESRAHLKTLLQRRESAGRKSEIRAQQANYTTRIADHFAPKTVDDSPHLLIAQAGTGIGKTYGYLAPAQMWAQANEGRVDRNRKAVIQKGRENYLCLLNLEELITSSAMAQSDKTIIAAGLMARWASATNDGDLTGNTFPGWLTNLLGLPNTLGLADRRGECIYAACDHYHKCFIEGMNRKAKRAEIVINNHALTMIRAATEASDAVTPFIVFDEAHHLFQAADSAYGANLTGLEGADLRRWLLGPEDQRRANAPSSRGRGLRKRLEGLLDESSPAFHDVGKIMVAARDTLPGPGWRNRVFKHDPFGTIEKLLSAITAHVQNRAKEAQSHYTIECDISPVTDDLIEKAETARASLKKLQKPLADLSNNLRALMEDNAGDWDKDTLDRLDNLSASIERRSTLLVSAWVMMVEELINLHLPRKREPVDEDPRLRGEGTEFINWFEITRIQGKNYDAGMFRRYKNPMEPFGNSIRHTAHGLIMTSATIRTNKGDTEHDWIEAGQQLGIKHLTDMTANKIDLPSPFQYTDQCKIIIVTDVNKKNAMEIANATKAIFEASNGGGLGLSARMTVHVYWEPTPCATALTSQENHCDAWYLTACRGLAQPYYTANAARYLADVPMTKTSRG